MMLEKKIEENVPHEEEKGYLGGPLLFRHRNLRRERLVK